MTNVETKAPTKAELAQKIFEEVGGVRADFMKRAMEELGMSKPGASTYHQNCKTKANGGKVKSYYKSKKTQVEEISNENVDDSLADAELFVVNLKDGGTQEFLSQEAADEWAKKNKKLVA